MIYTSEEASLIMAEMYGWPPYAETKPVTLEKLTVGYITADMIEIHDMADEAPNRLKGVTINEDGDAT